MNTTIADLKVSLEHKMDIEFRYNGIEYGIVSCTPAGIIAYVQNSGNQQVFQTAEELLDGFTIDNKRLRDIISQLEIILM